MPKPEWKKLLKSTPWKDLVAWEDPEELPKAIRNLAKPKKAADSVSELYATDSFLPTAERVLDIVSLMVAEGDAHAAPQMLRWMSDLGLSLLKETRREPEHWGKYVPGTVEAFHRAIGRVAPLADDPDLGPALATAEAVAALLSKAPDILQATIQRLERRYQSTPHSPSSAAYLGALAMLDRHLPLPDDAPIEHQIVAKLTEPGDDPDLAEWLVPHWALAKKLADYLPNEPLDLLRDTKPRTALALLRAIPRPGTLEAEALVSMAETSRALTNPVTETVLGWTTLKPRNHVKLLCRLERTPQVLDALHTAAERVVAQSKKPALKEADAEACVTAALALYESGDPRWVQHVLIQAKNWPWLLVELSRDERGLGSGQMLLHALRDEFAFHPALIERVSQALADPETREVTLSVICSWPRDEAAALLPQVKAVADEDEPMALITLAHLTGAEDDWRRALASLDDLDETVLAICPYQDWPQFLDLVAQTADGEEFRFYPAQLLERLVRNGRLTAAQAWAKLEALLAEEDEDMADAMDLALDWANNRLIDRDKVYDTIAGYAQPGNKLFLDAATALLRHHEKPPAAGDELVAELNSGLGYARTPLVIECAERVLALGAPQADAIRNWLQELLSSDKRIDSSRYRIPADVETCRQIETILKAHPAT